MISVRKVIIKKKCDQYSESDHYDGKELYSGSIESADRYSCICLISIIVSFITGEGNLRGVLRN